MQLVAREQKQTIEAYVMAVAPFSLREDYWENFSIQADDREFIYNYLLDKETPLTSQELLHALVIYRIQREKQAIEKQRSSGGDIYLPKNSYKTGQNLVFPAFNWERGKVLSVRAGQNPDLGNFEVIRVRLENRGEKELAANLANHALNLPVDHIIEDASLDFSSVINEYRDTLLDSIEDDLKKDSDFVLIAGKWFPRALLVDINIGHLNLAEAILDMAGGGPMSTVALMEQVGLTEEPNSKLVEFSLDLALQEDPRFDEVGAAGETIWFLQRLEPQSVQQIPPYLRYTEIDCDRSLLSPEMLALERKLDDELTPLLGKYPPVNEVQVTLIFPHWRSGTLPLSGQMRHLFPTAYEAPRIRFLFVDGETGQKFPGWVVRQHRYVYGLEEWYRKHNLMPGSLVRVRRGNQPGEVIVQCDAQRGSREWVRTVLVGSDGGIVFALLKQIVSASFDERMAIAIPDLEALDQAWAQLQKERQPFERVVVNIVRELARLNPQSHVHASELYAAINIIRRCPPGPLLALLASRPWFVHVGDLHFRFDDSEKVA
jgi:hypothetical protein